MADSDDIQAAIVENAKGPAEAAGDSGSVKQHDLADQIAAMNQVAANAAASKPHRGLRFTKLSLPPATG
jgi:hypothetical protein